MFANWPGRLLRTCIHFRPRCLLPCLPYCPNILSRRQKCVKKKSAGLFAKKFLTNELAYAIFISAVSICKLLRNFLTPPMFRTKPGPAPDSAGPGLSPAAAQAHQYKNLYSQPQFTVWPGLFPPCRVKFSRNKHNDSCENLPCLTGKSLPHPAVSAVNTGSKTGLP